MNEEEKRARTLSFMEQEQSRFLDTHSALDAAASNINASLTHSAKVREALSSLVQQGITWDELCDAYHTAFNDGQQAKMSFNLSFFTQEPQLPFTKHSVHPRKKPRISSVKSVILLNNPRIDPLSSSIAEMRQVLTPPNLMKPAHKPPAAPSLAPVWPTGKIGRP